MSAVETSGWQAAKVIHPTNGGRIALLGGAGSQRVTTYERQEKGIWGIETPWPGYVGETELLYRRLDGCKSAHLIFVGLRTLEQGKCASLG